VTAEESRKPQPKALSKREGVQGKIKKLGRNSRAFLFKIFKNGLLLS